MNRGLFCACAATALLAGCDLAPHYHVPLVQTPVTYEEAARWRPARPADDMPRGAWWTLYHDDKLNALEARVDGANPDLQSAQAAFDQARALAQEAEAGLFPQLSVGGHITTNRQSDRRPTRGGGQPNQYLDNAIDAQASYEIDVWDKVANAIKVGKATAAASQADLETTRLSLHAELASDYVTLRGLDAQADLLARTVAAYGQALTLTRNRFAGHIASGIDVSRAAAQLDEAQAQRADIAARRATTAHAIAILVGVPPAMLRLEPAIVHLPVPQIATGVPAALLQRRPDIASAERLMAAANADIGVTRAAFYPNITLNAIVGLQDTGFNMFNLPDSFWTVGPGVALPLFEGGLRNAEEHAAIAAYQRAAGNYKATVLNAFGEVEDELALLHWLGDEQEAEERGTADAAQTVDKSLNLYKEGATSYLDVVTAQTAELSAEERAIDVATRRLEASIALIRALGGGWTDAALKAG